MKGENGTPVTPEWELPKPSDVRSIPDDEPHIERGEN